MPPGTVKWFNTTKGYGFIEPENGDKDVFLHISAIERAGLNSPAEGQKLQYELETGRDGKVWATKKAARGHLRRMAKDHGHPVRWDDPLGIHQ